MFAMQDITRCAPDCALCRHRPLPAPYSDDIEHEIQRLSSELAHCNELHNGRTRWLAIQLLEGDADLLALVRATAPASRVPALLDESHARLRQEFGDDPAMMMVQERYRVVQRIVEATTTRDASQQATLSDRIDRVVTHRYLGIPIFLLLMYLVFTLVQHVSMPYGDWVDTLFNTHIATWVHALLGWLHAPAWLHSLAADGIIAGVGGVLVFVPGLVILYLALALLEESGYMARAAFVMDRFMSLLGLHGQAFLPMVLGFGCSVPAIYATRTIENRATRIVTGLMIPFMSCSAKLPVYVVFSLAFFPHNAGWIIWGMYLIGLVVASLLAIVFSRLVFKHQQSDLVIEVPPYRTPTLGGVLIATWVNISHFVRKAGTVILAMSVGIWLLLHLPWGVQQTSDSYYGRVSRTIAPIFVPAGFGEWQTVGALISGFVGKEIVVSSLAVVYGESSSDTAAAAPPPPTDVAVSPLADLRDIGMGLVHATGEASLRLLNAITPGINLLPQDAPATTTALHTMLRRAFTPLSSVAFLIFVLLYVPCMSTLAALVQEFGWRWAIVSLALQTTIPWTLAVLVYQGGVLLGLG